MSIQRRKPRKNVAVVGIIGQGRRLCAAETGAAITDPLWNMTYYSDDSSTDDILLETAGNVGRVTQDISSPVHIGTVTFTVAPGAHAAVQTGAPADGGLS